MLIADLLKKRNMTGDQLSEESGIPFDTLLNICRGTVSLQGCSDETVRKLAAALNVPAELLIEDSIRQAKRECAYEYGLPDYLQHDLDVYKEGLKNHSSLLDCLWGELYIRYFL